MKRTKRATFTAAALLSCTLAFSGCSLISQVVPDQDGTAGEQVEADGQQTEGQQPTGENDASQDAGGDSSDSGSSSSAEGTSNGTDGSNGTEGSDGGTAGSDDGTTGSDAGQSSGSQGEVSIGESFEDPEMQDKIEVLSAVRNFDSSQKATSIELGGEVVLLEVKITPGQKYSGLIQSGAFKISDDGGADYRYDQTDGLEAEMRAAGYEPFEDVTRRDGGTHQGWLAYVPDEKQDTYTIRYERGPGKVMGTEEKVPEFTTTFDIPSV
ncbi:transcriptional regulator [Brevibacterium limosum]|uniref:transcriptional regulator n=1 Tax=Brevibacterium limosum TaxID=2697565 RepID=UPI00141DE757|nr:transcriptional regulator [Brevibacterium limosum]